MFILWLSFILMSLFPQGETKAATKTASVKVDASKNLGKSPELLSSSVWISQPHEKDKGILIKFFKENSPAVIQLSLPLGGTDYESFKKELKAYLSNDEISIILKKVNENNSTLIVGFDPVPMRKWLSSRKNDERTISSSLWYSVESASPPLNYDLWGNVVKITLSYLKDSLGVNKLGFFVGHEPNRDWLGTEESFFKYYEYSAKAAKSVSASIKVGGMGSWDVYALKGSCDYPEYAPYVQKMCREDGGWANPNGEPMLKNFIRYVAKHNLPLDFVNWHAFGNLPENFFNIEGIIKGWLKDAGIKEENVKLFPSDWTYWTDDYPADYLDTQDAAAYYIRSLYYMWKGGIQWQGYDFNISDDTGLEKAARKDSTFIGDWSIFTRAGRIGGGVVKPVYNAMKALSIVTLKDGGETPDLISSESSENDTITAIATHSSRGKKISIIISNFFPSNKQMINRYISHLMQTKAGLTNEDKAMFGKCMAGKNKEGGRKEAILQCKNTLLKSIKDPKKAEAIEYLVKIYLCRENKRGRDCFAEASRDLRYPENKKIAEDIMNVAGAERNPTQVDITVTNIPFDGKANLVTYRVDSKNSNACSFNKNTEPSPTNAPCGIGGSVDKAIGSIRNELKASIKRELEQGNYPPEAVNALRRIMEECKTSIDKCLQDRNISMENKKKLMTVLGKAREIASKYYGSAIEKVNEMKEISLEGSREEGQVEVSDGTLKVKTSIEPNSIYLLVLKGM
jgi:hypothetical protein